MKNKITGILTGSYIWIFLTLINGIFLSGGEPSCSIYFVISTCFGLLAGFTAAYLVGEKELLVSSLAAFMGILPLQLMFLRGSFEEGGLFNLGIVYLFIPVIGGLAGGFLAKLLKKRLKKFD